MMLKRESKANQQPSKFASWKTVAFTAILSAGAALFAERHLALLMPALVMPNGKNHIKTSRQCRPPLPNLFAENPIQADQPEIKIALQRVDAFIRKSFAASQIDGLAVGIVTSKGAIYEIGMGPLKANETDAHKRGTIDRNSIFRLASGSKLFVVMEAFILREKGALHWDDPIDKFFPGFTYVDGGWTDLGSAPLAPASKPKASITLRQLASHMSGLGREYPRGDMKNWPHSVEGAGPPPLNGWPFPTTQEMIEGLPKYPLVVPTYSYPVYSNAGMAVLGEAAVAANAAFEIEKGVTESPTTWQALVRRDIFDPLGLNGSSFVVTPENAAHVAVSSLNSDEVDLDFLDPMSCSGGQMSSLSDYIKVMLTILDPTRPESLLPSYVIREWLRPLYGWTDETTEVGMLWEIEKICDSYKRPLRIFQKLGVLGGSRSVFAINQDMSYGVALLMTGTSDAASNIALDIFRYIQPTLDLILAREVEKLYSGRWRSSEGDSEIVLGIDDGSLWISKLILNGTDVLRLTQGIPCDEFTLKQPVPITLWSTGRHHEFRMLFGALDEFGELSYSTCLRFWESIDSGFSRGYPMDLLYFTESQYGLVLHVPSADVTLIRR